MWPYILFVRGLGQPSLDHNIDESNVKRSISDTLYSQHGHQADLYIDVEWDSEASLSILKIEFNEDYVTLFDNLEHVMTELRGQIWQKQHHQRRKHKQLQFNHRIINISFQIFLNVITESCKLIITTNHQSFTLKDYTESIIADIELSTRDKLKQDIEHCEKYYQWKTFIVNSDKHSETV